mmetsp:Transcript_48916/g.81210  ORF Transcript_48916/g.81210 Transcript_48916/m.81210 type:complete len:436 (+) Transcript_48916:1375-2682(+)
MNESLRDPNHVQMIRLFLCAIVFRQLAQHTRNSRIIRTSTNNTQRQNGIARHIFVVIMRQLAECVTDLEQRITHRNHRQRQWHCTLHSNIAVLYQMHVHAQAHGSAEFLAERNNADAECRNRLVVAIVIVLVLLVVRLILILLSCCGFLLLLLFALLSVLKLVVKMFADNAEHLLNLEHIASASIRQTLETHFGALRKFRIEFREHIHRFQCHIHFFLFAEKEESQSEHIQQKQRIVQCGRTHFGALHQIRQNNIANLGIASANIIVAQTKCRQTRHLIALLRANQLLQCLVHFRRGFRLSSIRQSQSKNTAQSLNFLTLAFFIECGRRQQCQPHTTLALHTTATDTDGEIGASSNMRLCRLKISINAIGRLFIPQHDITNTGHRRQLSTLLVLCNPIIGSRNRCRVRVIATAAHHKLVASITAIDKRIHIRNRQ